MRVPRKIPLTLPSPPTGERGFARQLARFAARLLFILSALGAGPAFGADVWTDRDELDNCYRAELAALADWCDSHHLAEQAAQTRAWAQPRDPRRLYLVMLSHGDSPTATSPRATTPVSAHRDDWRRRFDELRRAQAERLLELARRALRQHHVSLAYELVLAVARENPDQEDARRLLGYQRYQNQWRTVYDIRKLRSGHVWHDRFGWLPKSHAARYEADERFYEGRWITADDEARLRADIARGWQIETEHYLVTTNHSLERGVALGRRLEQLYEAWRQAFARYYATEAQWKSLFEGRSIERAESPRHRVVYFRSRDEYNHALQGATAADIAITTGIYVGDARTAYFFADENQDNATLYHEATHQLFSESRRVVPNIAAAANFWIVEGIACYMETLAERDGRYTLGGDDSIRFEAARYRLLEGNFYVPLAEFVRMGMNQLQQDPRIATLYSQAAGLSHFLMHDRQGRYRDALIEYLIAIYTGRDQLATLADVTAMPLDLLDRQYRQFMTDAGR